VMQYNKIDLREQGIPLLPLQTLERDLNSQLKTPSFAASAVLGTNVVATLKRIITLTVSSIKKDLK
jgi:mutual gliding-motility protein MglA